VLDLLLRWLLPGAVLRRWLLPGAAGCCLVPLAAARRHRLLLGAAGCCSAPLAAAWRRWLLLGAAGCKVFVDQLRGVALAREQWINVGGWPGAINARFCGRFALRNTASGAITVRYRRTRVVLIVGRDVGSLRVVY